MYIVGWSLCCLIEEKWLIRLDINRGKDHLAPLDKEADKLVNRGSYTRR